MKKPPERGLKDKNMNLDFIHISKHIGKDTTNFAYLQEAATYNDSTKKYVFDRCEKLQIFHNPNTNILTVKGSLPYWLNGHNYNSSIEDWKEGLDYLSGCLNTNIYTGNIEAFEFGSIQEIPFSASSLLHNHISIKGMTPQEYRQGKTLTGKYFKSPALTVKMYDAGRNIKKLNKAIRETLSKSFAWDSTKQYIKLENHYKKPYEYFKQQLTPSILISDHFQKVLQMDLIETYSKIMKTGKIKLPENKKDINAGTIPLMVLLELSEVYGFNAEEMLKTLLKEIPQDIMSKEDIKARLHIIRSNLRKLQSSQNSEFDISKLLHEKITIPDEALSTSSFLYEGKGEEIFPTSITA